MVFQKYIRKGLGYHDANSTSKRRKDSSRITWKHIAKLTAVQKLSSKNGRRVTFDPPLGAPRVKSVFTGLNAVSKLSYTIHAMQQMHGLRRNQNTEIRNEFTRKKSTQSFLFFVCIAFFSVFRDHALRVLHCVRQLGNRPLSPFSAF